MGETDTPWKGTFDSGGVMTAAQALKVMKDKSCHYGWERESTQARTERHNARSDPDISDILMALPYILAPPDELQAMSREAEARKEALLKRRAGES